MSKTFCVLPWINISVDPTGDIKPCCVFDGKIYKDDGTPYNLGYDSIEDIYNSNEFVTLRKQMLDGTPIKGCSQCYEHEQFGGVSNRTQHNSIWMKQAPVLKKVAQGTKITTDIHYFDLRLGNLCNLSCKSCSPVNSSQLAKEVAQIPKASKFYSVKIEDMNSWHQTEQFMFNLNSQIHNIKQLYVTGGEPTIIKENYTLLKKIVESGHSKSIKLHLNTNMTNINSEFYELLIEFEEVVFYASIDGIGHTQEYLRYPSNWNQIDKNIKKLLPSVRFSVRPTPVIQIGNLNRLVELFEYFESFNYELNRSAVQMTPLILQNPKHLDCLYLPTEFKIAQWEKINNWIETRCKFQSPIFHEKMKILKNKCLEAVDYQHNLNTFFEVNDMFDQHRNFYLKDVNPELDNLRAK